MQTCQRVSDLRAQLAQARSAGKRIALVATMGNLHEGHLQLIRLAKTLADVVVASIFVNPLQFGLNEDWEQYPRTLERDSAMLSAEGCDLLFCPTETDMYPNGMETQTKVEVPTMTNILCGASRPGHFLGVTTVVAKLLNMVQPDTAIFGIKDYQQLTVINRMVEDLCIPVQIVAAPIARADDGLALSSRNSYLTAEERPRAVALYQALCHARDTVQAGARDYATIEASAQQQLAQAGMRPDYFSIRQAKTLEPATASDTDLVLLGAVYLGKTRLIDNVTLTI
ncbi:MAG: pantoate--beta-alanine ligase [Cellvibrionales bacterium]|nr:MAG: pantoate--beta-alanine ligase [Cellvibrionales bacterium]